MDREDHRYTIGIDVGTLSGRAVLVDVSTGEEVATHVYAYANGVIDRHLPGNETRLPPPTPPCRTRRTT